MRPSRCTAAQRRRHMNQTGPVEHAFSLGRRFANAGARRIGCMFADVLECVRIVGVLSVSTRGGARPSTRRHLRCTLMYLTCVAHWARLQRGVSVYGGAAVHTSTRSHPSHISTLPSRTRRNRASVVCQTMNRRPRTGLITTKGSSDLAMVPTLMLLLATRCTRARCGRSRRRRRRQC